MTTLEQVDTHVAMKFSQAAVNAANAFSVVKYIGTQPEPVVSFPTA